MGSKIAGGQAYEGVIVVDPDTGLPIGPAAGSISAAGVSNRGTVDTSGTQTIAAAGSVKRQLMVMNTDAANNLALSFSSPALSTDVVLTPGQSVNFAFGPNNALYGLGIGGACAFATIGG